MKIVVTGASGFIGGAVSRALRARGDEVYAVVRRPPRNGEVGVDLARRQLDTSLLPGGSLEGVDAAVHLAGAPITARWSAKRLEEIRASRVSLGDIVARSLASLEDPPAVLVSGSAVGIYGDRGDEVLDETSAEGWVSADLCRSWEAATRPAAERGHQGGHDPDRHRSRGHRGRRGRDTLAPRCPSSSSGSGPASATAASGQAGSPSTTRSPSCSARSTTPAFSGR